MTALEAAVVALSRTSGRGKGYGVGGVFPGVRKALGMGALYRGPGKSRCKALCRAVKGSW